MLPLVTIGVSGAIEMSCYTYVMSITCQLTPLK